MRVEFVLSASDKEDAPDCPIWFIAIVFQGKTSSNIVSNPDLEEWLMN